MRPVTPSDNSSTYSTKRLINFHGSHLERQQGKVSRNEPTQLVRFGPYGKLVLPIIARLRVRQLNFDVGTSTHSPGHGGHDVGEKHH